MRLLWLESKRLFCSFAFLIYSLLVCSFIILNVNPIVNQSLATMPTPNHYDELSATDFHTLKNGTLNQLNTEFTTNSYTTYPLGFSKSISLTPHKRLKMHTQITKLQRTTNRKAFEATLVHVNKLIGGNSAYTPNNVPALARRQMTPNEAQHDYQLILTADQISGTFARFFADITDLIIGILPTIIVLTFCYADRRSHVTASIRSKHTSCGRRLITQYTASLLVLLFPVIVMGLYFTLRILSLYPHHTLDLFAFIKVILIWILPTLMITSAVGFLTYQLFGNFAGFALQIGWWLTTIMIGSHRVAGYYSWLLMPRHNSLHNVAYFYDHITELLINRTVYTLLALILISIAVSIAQQRNGGHPLALPHHHQRFQS